MNNKISMLQESNRKHNQCKSSRESIKTKGKRETVAGYKNKIQKEAFGRS